MSISPNSSMSIALCIFLQLLAGCSPAKPPAGTVTTNKPESEAASEPAPKTNSSAGSVSEKKKSGGKLPAIISGGGSSKPAASSVLHQKEPSKVASSDAERILSHLKELQILLGTCRGITKKAYGGFKAVDEMLCKSGRAF